MSGKRIRLFLALGVACVTLLGVRAARADFLWIGTGKTGSWKDPLNWENGKVPPATDNTTGVRFGGAPTQLSTTQDVANPLTLNRITFDAKAGQQTAPFRGYTIGGDKIIFDGDNPAIMNNSVQPTGGSISHRITAPLDLTKDTTIGGSGSVPLIVSSISGTAGLIKDGSYTLQFTGNTGNAYTGTTTVNGGLLQLSKTNGVAVSGDLVIANGNGGTARVQVDALVSNRTSNQQMSGNTNVTVNAGGTLTIQGSPAAGTTNTQTIKTIQGGGNVVLQAASALQTGGLGKDKPFSGVMSGAGSLVKIGNNGLVLTGNNTYTGSTTVKEGTLTVDGQIGTANNRTGPVTVQRNGLLNGTGKIFTGARASGVRINADGTIQPGKSPGIFTIDGDVQLDAGAIFQVDLEGPTPGNGSGFYGQLVVNGEVDLDGSILSAALGYVPSFSDKLFIISNTSTGPTRGKFAQGNRIDLESSVDHALYEFQIGYNGDFESNSVTGGNDVVLFNARLVAQTVPEPWSLTLFGVGTVGLLGFARRRRRPSDKANAGDPTESLLARP